MRSPFAIFRKNSKVAMAFLVFMAMFAFVFLDSFQRGGGGSIGSAEVVVKLKGGDLDRMELQNLIAQRQRANGFVQNAFFAVSDTTEMNQMKMQQLQSRLQSFLFGFGRNIQEDVVLTYLLGKEAHRMGIQLSDAAVEDFIDRLTENKLSTEQFKNIVRDMQRADSRTNRLELYNAIRGELEAQLAFRMSAPVNPQSPDQYWDYYRRLRVQQSLEVAAIPVKEFTNKVPKPDDKKLEAYFDKHKTELPNRPPEFETGFKQPRKVQVQYLKATYVAVEELVPEVTEEDVEKYYEENKDALYKEASLDFAKPDADSESKPLDPEFAPEKPETETPDTPEGKSDSEKPEGEKPAEKPEAEKKPEDPAPEKESTPEKPAAEEKPEAKPKDAKPEEAKSDDGQASIQNEGNLELLADGTAEVTEGTTVNEDSAAEEPKTEEKPADEKPAPEKPADDKPADDPPKKDPAPEGAEKPEAPAKEEGGTKKEGEEKPEKETPEGEPPAETETEEPPKYKPLDEDLREDIREQLLRERTITALKDLAEQTMTKLDELAVRYNSFPSKSGDKLFIDLNENGELDQGEPTVDAPKGRPESLTDAERKKLYEQVAVIADARLQKLGEELGMSYGQTGLVSAAELQDIPGLGRAADGADNPFAGTGIVSLIEQTFSDEQLYRTGQASDLETQDLYVFWKVADVAEHVPSFKDPGIQEQVLASWKAEQAIPLAEARATELAKRIANAKKPMEAALAEQTVTGEKGGIAVTVHLTPSFSWMRESSAPSDNPFAPKPPPQISSIPFIDAPGDDFMRTVFEDLQVGETGIAFNADNSVCYVVRVESRTPGTPEEFKALREEFLKSNLFGFDIPGFRYFSTPYQDLALAAQQTTVFNWVEALEKNYAVEWVKSSDN